MVIVAFLKPSGIVLIWAIYDAFQDRKLIILLVFVFPLFFNLNIFGNQAYPNLVKRIMAITITMSNPVICH